MITISEQVKKQLADDVRAMEKTRCENIIRSHYCFVEDLDPYDIAEHLPETIELLTSNCLDVAHHMFDRLEKDSIILEEKLGVKKNDTLIRVEVLDYSCEILALIFESGARIVYKDTPSQSYDLWECAAAKAGLHTMDVLSCGDYLYCEFIERAPLEKNQDPGDYYYHLGKLFALSHLFGAGDFNAGNLHPVGTTPILIDCDMMLYLGEPYWRIAANGCLPYDDGDKYQRPAQKTPFYHGSTCPFDKDGTVYLFEDYVQEIKRGYEDCALNTIPLLRDEFIQKAQGARYRYLPIDQVLYLKIFKQRIIFGYREPKSDNEIIQGIMESVNQLKQLKFYAEIDGDTLYCADSPIGKTRTITTELLSYRFDTIPTEEDIAIQLGDIDYAANELRAARKQDSNPDAVAKTELER